jgi:hypothetical protein
MGTVPVTRLAALLGPLTVVLGLVTAGPAAGEPLRPGVIEPAGAAVLSAELQWSALADTFDELGATPDPLHAAADAASVLSWRVTVEGWHGPDVPGLVADLLAGVHPDGGYGLTQAWDAYQDGTVNPATTSYTATTAGHVGPVLLAGYQAGAVPLLAVRRAIDWVLDLPRSHRDRCIPYSNSPFDRDRPCVWNVHFGAADWVLHASRVTGYRTADARRLAGVALSWLDAVRQDPVTGYWPYSSAGGPPQDISHQLWTATAVDHLRGTRVAVPLMLSRPLWRAQARRMHDSTVASAMAAIAGYDCRYATDPTVLAYSRSTEHGSPFLFKALATQARVVLHGCFPPGQVGTVGTGRRPLGAAGAGRRPPGAAGTGRRPPGTPGVPTLAGLG